MKALLILITLLAVGGCVYLYGPWKKSAENRVDSEPAAKAPPVDPPLVEALQASLRDKESEANIAKLLSSGADANATDKSGRPALSLAVRNNDTGAIEALLKAGANPNARDKEMQWTPLMVASFQAARDPAFLKTVELLLQHGADVHANKEGTTALHVAVNNLDANARDVRIIETLLKAGASVDGEPPASPDSFTLSPLMSAAISGKTAVALALAQGGAKLTAEKGAKTPAQTARDHKHPELAAALEKLEKKQTAPPPKRKRR